MANIKISNLPAAADVTGDDLLPVVDGGTTTQKATFQQVLDYVTGSTFNDLSVTSLTASVTGTFTGDGSGITGVTGEWDGSHTGDASITGSLFVTQELDVSSWLRGSRIVVDQFVTASLYMLAPEFRGDLIGTASAVENCLQDGDGINITDHCYNGASVGYVMVDSTVVRLTGSQTLTNKIFGDSAADVHQFTGSIHGTQTISGSIIEATDIIVSDGTVGNNLQVDGFLGVNTTPGTYALSVAGEVRTTGTYRANKSGYDTLSFVNQPQTSGGHYIAMGMASQTEARMTAAGVTPKGNSLTFYTSENGVEAEKMKITDSGSVGIGTSAPAAKLDVNGSLIANVALSGAVGSEITSTSYTLSTDDRGKTLLFSSSATQGITCSSGLDVGYNTTFIQLGSGQLELSASVGSSILNRQSHTKTAGLYAAASVVIISANTYLFAGDTSA